LYVGITIDTVGVALMRRASDRLES
jgi:hypothetical protein